MKPIYLIEPARTNTVLAGFCVVRKGGEESGRGGVYIQILEDFIHVK